MADKIKTLIGFLFFIAGTAASFIGLGWSLMAFLDPDQPQPWLGIGMGVIAFLVCMAIGAAFLFWVEDLTWLTVAAPYLFSILYSIIPDFPLSFDDAAVMAAGAIFSAILAIRKNPQTPRWIFIPLIGAAVYTLVGGTIPGPVDELLVDLVAMLVAAYGISNSPDDPEEH